MAVRNWTTSVSVLALIAALSACGGSSSPGVTAQNSQPPAPTATKAERHACPYYGGGGCLGPLDPGTYHSQFLRPRVTYTVPEGWENTEDIPGDLLLLPPGGQLSGVDAGTSDLVGVYPSVAPPKGCHPGAAPGVPKTVGGFKQWIADNPALDSPTFKSVTVGGLSGFVTDLRLVPGYKGSCFYSNSHVPLAPLLYGYGPSHGVEHNVFSHNSVTRLYVVDYHGHAMAIELVDIKDKGHLNSFSKVVHTFQFKT